MYATFCVSRETADRFIRLFVNRRAYGMQAVHPLPNGSVPYYLARDWQTKKPKPLDAGVVRMHLNGDITINLYAINPETQRSKWVAIDADFDGAVEALFQLQWELKQDGVEAALEQSRRGGHLWIFADAPLLAAECRIYIYNLALRLGVPVKGGGLKDGIEGLWHLGLPVPRQVVRDRTVGQWMNCLHPIGAPVDKELDEPVGRFAAYTEGGIHTPTPF